MLKSLFGMFGKDKADGANGAATATDAVKAVAAVADKGTNVARDASTKVDDAIEAERARREGNGTPGDADADDAEGSGLSRD